MLIAHLVPGYLAATAVEERVERPWRGWQRPLLWAAALLAAAAPDLDVVYNVLCRGFFGHTTLWTHSLFVYLALGLGAWPLPRTGRTAYLRLLLGLAVAGGLSHLALDAATHGTPLFYPLSLHMFGAPSARVLQGGLWAYLTDPLFLAEPLLLALAAAHWTLRRKAAPRAKRLALAALACAFLGFSAAFLLFLPQLQRLAGAPLSS